MCVGGLNCAKPRISGFENQRITPYGFRLPGFSFKLIKGAVVSYRMVCHYRALKNTFKKRVFRGQINMGAAIWELGTLAPILFKALGRKYSFPVLFDVAYFLTSANICLNAKCNALNALRQCFLRVTVVESRRVAFRSHQNQSGSCRH